MRNKNYWGNIISYGFLAISISTFAFTIGYIRGVLIEREAQGYGLLNEVKGLLSEYYIGDLPPHQTLEYGAVRGMITAVGDQYSIFLEPPARELEAQSLQGEFGGIGVNIRRGETGEIVLSPFPDYPAIKAGVQEGDILLEVDDTPITAEMALDQVSVLVRGEIGSQVRIKFQHGADAPQDVMLTREKVEIPSVTSRILEQDSTIGLVSISRFSDKTAGETRQSVEDLQSQGATRIIIDLRGNGGGLLDAAVDTAKLFLDGGVIMYEDKRSEDEKIYEASTNSFAPDIPIAILVNHGTASASEILAGALHDRGRAPLIAQPTYGKGSVQLVFELSDHSSVHITNARWFTPGRLQLDGVGITPDIEVQPGTDGTDPELDRAIEYLQNQG